VSACSNRGNQAQTTSGRYLFDLCLSSIMWAVCLNRPRDFSLFPSGSLLKRTWVISFNKLNSLPVYRSLHAILTLEQQFSYRQRYIVLIIKDPLRGKQTNMTESRKMTVFLREIIHTFYSRQ